jgi:hypothetical protein
MSSGTLQELSLIEENFRRHYRERFKTFKIIHQSDWLPRPLALRFSLAMSLNSPLNAQDGVLLNDMMNRREDYRR